MDLLIFDMDGVLVDVSRSYRETIRQTVLIYLKMCLGFRKGRGKSISKEEIALFKSAGGFNNDWDLTSGLLLYLLSVSRLPPLRKRQKFNSISETLRYLKSKSSGLYPMPVIQLNRRNLLGFLKKVRSFGGGLKGVRRALTGSWDGWVYGSGDLDQENLVKRIFQEVYLGRQFTSCYHLRPLFYQGQGLYLQERLLIPRTLLSLLHKKMKMGIASGRPRFEAELALRRFGLLPYFDSVVTLDDCMEEEARIFRSTRRRISCSKPHPYSLLRVIQEIGTPHPTCGYVGDVVDDMVAAKSLKDQFPMIAIGFMSGRHRPKSLEKSLRKAGADFVVKSPKELLQLLSSQSSLLLHQTIRRG
ncbi:MAG: HAD family hydrolase [Thermodesulfobacteriota bacterium]